MHITLMPGNMKSSLFLLLVIQAALAVVAFLPYPSCCSSAFQTTITVHVTGTPARSPSSTLAVYNNYGTSRKKQKPTLVTLFAGLDKGFNLLEVASGIVPQGQIVTVASESWKFVWKRFMAELAPQDRTTGSYQRPRYGFAARIGDPDHPDQAGRYHLYTGNPCPWCHRVVLAVKLLGLTNEQIGWTVLEDNPRKASRGGWIFANGQPDPDFHCTDLRQLYNLLSPGYQGRCTAPLLVDKVSRTIVSNESSDIVRMLQQATLGGGAATTERINLLPEPWRAAIDEMNEWVYRLLNNGVYRCGFSTTQAAYDAAVADVQEGLERCEGILQTQPFLCGSQFTEADLRLLPTMLRFDAVYGPFFKASYYRVRDFPALHAWLQRCWDMPGVPESIDLADACSSYYRQLFPLNPGGIVPAPVTARTLGLVDRTNPTKSRGKQFDLVATTLQIQKSGHEIQAD